MKDIRPDPGEIRLAVEDIGHSYDGTRVLEGVSLELGRGEVASSVRPTRY